MEIYKKEFQTQKKCQGCKYNYHTHYIIADNKEAAKNDFRKTSEKGSLNGTNCAECILDVASSLDIVELEEL